MASQLPVPSIRYFSFYEDRAWLLTSALAGRTGDAWLAADPASLPMVIVAFACFLRRLHALPIDGCPFEASAMVRLADARRAVSQGRVDVDDFDASHRGWSAGRMLAETEALLPSNLVRCFTHGDFSLGNVLIGVSGQVTGCIDVGRAGIADPYQDIAIFWQNLADHGEDAQRLFLDTYGLREVDQRRLDFHRCLDELF